MKNLFVGLCLAAMGYYVYRGLKPSAQAYTYDLYPTTLIGGDSDTFNVAASTLSAEPMPDKTISPREDVTALNPFATLTDIDWNTDYKLTATTGGTPAKKSLPPPPGTYL